MNNLLIFKIFPPIHKYIIGPLLCQLTYWHQFYFPECVYTAWFSNRPIFCQINLLFFYDKTLKSLKKVYWYWCVILWYPIKTQQIIINSSTWEGVPELRLYLKCLFFLSEWNDMQYFPQCILNTSYKRKSDSDVTHFVHKVRANEHDRSRIPDFLWLFDVKEKLKIQTIQLHPVSLALQSPVSAGSRLMWIMWWHKNVEVINCVINVSVY